MFDEVPDSDFLRAVNLSYEDEGVRLNVATLTVDLFFAVYLRQASRFGFFDFGPVCVDVNLIEDIVERTVEQRPPGETGPPPFSDEMVRWSQTLMAEVRRSGRRRIDELHCLLAFMRFDEGLPKRVFSELGVMPEQVEAYARTRSIGSPELEKLYSPEEVAEYLNIHVQTVRTWIRSGRLPARRLVGQRALRIREADIPSLLVPLEGTDDHGEP